MDVDFSIRQLRYFVVVAEELSFTRAAEQLQIAQPPLSRQIRSLEKILGFVLLERTNRRVALTTAGEIFLAECYQILSRVEQGVQAARRVAQGEAGQLIVGFEGVAHNELVLDIIRQMRTHFPEIALVMQEMSSGKQVAALSEKRLDIGLIEPIAAEGDIKMVSLLSEPLVVALAETHPLADQAQIALSQLADDAWVTGRRHDGCGLLLRILAACRQAGFTPKVQQETNDLQMTLGFVASGLGVTLLPKSSMRSQTGITYCPIKTPVPEVKLAIAWQASRRSPVIASFLQVAERCLEIELMPLVDV